MWYPIVQDGQKLACFENVLGKTWNAEVSKHWPHCECQHSALWFLSLCFCVSCWIFGCTYLAANFKIYSRGHKLKYFDLKSHLVWDNVRASDYAGCLLKERVWPRISGHLCWAIILSRWKSEKKMGNSEREGEWWWWCTFDLLGHVKQREL